MKNTSLIVLVFGGLVCLVSPARVLAQDNFHPPVTLYSTIKHRGEHHNNCLNLVTGSPEPRTPDGRCDVGYGFLYAGDELDWFESSTAADRRSVIKDLGMKSWNAELRVPVVSPLARLKPGEQRQVTVDTSGAGADPEPDPYRRLRDVREDPDWSYRPGANNNRKAGSSSHLRHDGKPRVDPKFVKAIVGHMYVIHVVDEVRDFYALFRVEALERGDNCTISWKFIPAPDRQTRVP